MIEVGETRLHVGRDTPLDGLPAVLAMETRGDDERGEYALRQVWLIYREGDLVWPGWEWEVTRTG